MTTAATATTANPVTPAQPGAEAVTASVETQGTATENAREVGLRRELEKVREQKRSLEAEKAARDSAEKTAETDRLTKNQEFQKLADQRAEEVKQKDAELTALRGRQDAVYIDAELRAKRFELLDPDDLALFSTKDLTVEAGEVKGLDDKWTDFKKRKPHLFRQAGTTTTGTARTAAVHPGGGATPSSDEVDPRKMTTEQWNTFVQSQRRH